MTKKWWTLVAVCAGTFMLLLDVTIVNVALPDIQTSLDGSFSQLQWVVDAYALSLAALLLTTGALADRFGRRLMFSGGLIVFTSGSLLCGVAQGPEMLILSRAVQGIGGAAMFATSLALLASNFHGAERGTAFGIWGAVTGVSTALGPILGGVITTGISWRGIFLVNIPIGIAALAVTYFKVEETKSPSTRRLDVGGFVLLTGGLVSLVYGMIRAGERSWTEHGVYLCLGLGVVLLIAFLINEAIVASPLFDLGLFRIPTFVGGSIAALCMNGSLFAMYLYIAVYLQDLLGYSALQTGVRLLMLSGATLIAATLSGIFSDKISARWLVGPGLLIVGLGLLLMANVHATSSWTHLIPGLIIAGIGSGLVNPPLASTAVGVVHPMRSGMASGVNSTFRQVGIAAGIAALGSLFSSQLTSHIAARTGSKGASTLAEAVRNGDIGRLLSQTPAGQRAHLTQVISSSFTSSLNDLFLVSACVAFAGGLLSLLLIRKSDFVTSEDGDTSASAHAQPRSDSATPAAPAPSAG